MYMYMYMSHARLNPMHHDARLPQLRTHWLCFTLLRVLLWQEGLQSGHGGVGRQQMNPRFRAHGDGDRDRHTHVTESLLQRLQMRVLTASVAGQRLLSSPCRESIPLRYEENRRLHDTTEPTSICTTQHLVSSP